MVLHGPQSCQVTLRGGFDEPHWVRPLLQVGLLVPECEHLIASRATVVIPVTVNAVRDSIPSGDLPAAIAAHRNLTLCILAIFTGAFHCFRAAWTATCRPTWRFLHWLLFNAEHLRDRRCGRALLRRPRSPLKTLKDGGRLRPALRTRAFRLELLDTTEEEVRRSAEVVHHVVLLPLQSPDLAPQPPHLGSDQAQLVGSLRVNQGAGQGIPIQSGA
mmetsp:Transcript_99578/g.213316  ORF Transcript_99578/g.213316 Transcript_99578/m.213316 type:complete len:216 (+) Transcript_99578:105-752(+)